MLRLIKNHPLVSVLLLAAVLRAVAVVFSKGYAFSDDHYETVSVAYNWLRHGLLAPNGLLTWGDHTPGDIARFPLYTLFLYGIMKIYHACGIDRLATMMYGIRAAHAALSLIPVFAVYRATELVTGSRKWAALGGLIVAAHFAMPFLSVRTLIEMVGCFFWTWALYYAYRYSAGSRHARFLVIAGLISGLAWMIRFQVIFAVVAIPLVLIWEYRRLRDAAAYSVSFFGMVLLAGFVDWWLLGNFMGSSLNHLRQGLTEQPPYDTSVLIYPGVLILFFIPPFSLMAFYLAALKRFWQNHKLLLSTLSFVVLHTIISARQERYMLPVVGAVMLMIVLVIHWQYQTDGILVRRRRWFSALVGFTIGLNLILLVPFTVNYGHRGLVEPLVRLERLAARPFVLFVTPEHRRIFPLDYGGFDGIERRYIANWEDLKMLDDSAAVTESIDYFLVYPGSESALPRCLDSLVQRVGELDLLFHIKPSLVDRIIHAANPEHNPNDEVWVFTPRNRQAGPGPPEPSDRPLE